MPGRMVYRPVVGRVCAAGFAGFASWWLVAVLLGPDPAVALVVGPALLTAVVAVYAVLWRPALVVDEEGVRLVNVFRDVDVPWAVLEGVQTRYALTLLVGERRFASWAAAAPGRPGMSGAALPGLLAPARSGRRDGMGGPPGGHRLPDRRWTGGHGPDRASRDLRADSGAAAFLVEQGWSTWRERPAVAGPDPGQVRVRTNRVLVGLVGGGFLVSVLAAVLRR